MPLPRRMCQKTRPHLLFLSCQFLLLGCAILSGCHSNSGRYSQAKDGLPNGHINLNQIHDAVVKREPRSKRGNPLSYKVLGHRYYPLKSSRGFKERGIASWYGSKFQGHLTSMGERYDPFSMTGAHKTLPLPTYAKITNLDNGKSTIIRINDRGPFHDNRILDLSYAAALKLGITAKGTGFVEIKALDPGAATHLDSVPEPFGNTQLYLQVAAFSDQQRAQNVLQSLRSIYSGKAEIKPVNINHHAIFRLRLGPLKDSQAAINLKNQLVAFNLPDVLLIYE